MLLRKEYRDEEGRKFLVDIPEGYDDMMERGIIIGPPVLDSLNLPRDIEILLNNQLYERKLFTWSDVRLRPDEIEAALRTVLKAHVRQIKELYMEVKDANL